MKTDNLIGKALTQIAELLTRVSKLERSIDMEGKIVASGTFAYANTSTKTETVTLSVDYDYIKASSVYLSSSDAYSVDVLVCKGYSSGYPSTAHSANVSINADDSTLTISHTAVSATTTYHYNLVWAAYKYID
jgi:hypothetical protein